MQNVLAVHRQITSPEDVGVRLCGSHMYSMVISHLCHPNVCWQAGRASWHLTFRQPCHACEYSSTSCSPSFCCWGGYALPGISSIAQGMPHLLNHPQLYPNSPPPPSPLAA